MSRSVAGQRRSIYAPLLLPFQNFRPSWLARPARMHFISFLLPGCGTSSISRYGREARLFQFLSRRFRGVALLAGAVHDDWLVLATGRLLHAWREIGAVRRNIDRSWNSSLLKRLRSKSIDQCKAWFLLRSAFSSSVVIVFILSLHSRIKETPWRLPLADRSQRIHCSALLVPIDEDRGYWVGHHAAGTRTLP